MMFSHRFIILCFSLLLVGCQGTNGAPQLQQFLPNLERNTVRVDDFILKMKWCSISEERTAECEVEITSLYQDKKSGIAYPKLQDNTGKEFRMNRKDGAVGGQVMVAGQPYTHSIVAGNLPTYSTHVRSVVGTFVIWDLRGIKIGSKPITFSNIPQKPAHNSSHAISKSTPQISKQVETVPKKTHQTGNLINSYWHGKITSVVEAKENEIMRLWRRGAYIHFREDGIAGYNWSEAKNYNYHDFNTWTQKGTTFTLTMSGAVYTFTTDSKEEPLVAYLQQGGAFKMTMNRR